MAIEWTQGECAALPRKEIAIPAAAYVRMSTDHQQFSTDNQLATIRHYAERYNFEIVRTYADDGKSGLSLAGRDALQNLLQDVENGLASFRTILVYDVSRLGRFQDPDEAAEIELRCKRRGTHVHYCAEQFSNDGTIGSTILKTVKRAMAGEYSRELSTKVFAGQVNLVRLGFHQGGPAGYGLRRLLVDQTGKPKCELARREQKSIATDRVILVPGPAEEIAVVQEIYHLFVRERRSEVEIAEVLNGRGLVTDLERRWTRAAVRQILVNDKYVGDNVWGRTSRKLKQAYVRNPRSNWIRAARAFEAIIDQEIFDQARAILAARTARVSDETMLQKLSALFERNGYLSRGLLDATGDCPSRRYERRFGSLRRAYALVGYVSDRDYAYLEFRRALSDLRSRVLTDVLSGIEAAGGSVSVRTNRDLIVVNGEFTASVLIARCMRTAAGKLRWTVRLNKSVRPDLLIVVRMRPENACPQDYYLLPSIDVHGPVLKFWGINDFSLDSYRCETLSRLYAMAARTFWRSSDGRGSRSEN
ncbi:serine recombinase [Sinorhizobium glycinis]|uniref:Serine recombinase n=1 Tax=Sinorhizobium glycinis TaxID=1472378 RepID=A0A178XIX3_9HYPH|nr:recombinase family protein [Sinorhizobium glycinis]OAP35166.1 serine recombinase [Sinorhizobium glycinis]